MCTYDKNLYKFAYHCLGLDNKVNMLLNEYIKDYKIINTGVVGENKINEVLDFFEDDIIVLRNVIFEDGKNSAENDFIVLSTKGIFSLEVKNLGSGGKYSLEISKDGRWSKVYGDEKESIESISAQSAKHIILSRKMINEELSKMGISKKIEINDVVVLANDKVDIINETDNTIIRYSELYGLLDRGENKYTKDFLKKVAKAIQNINKEEHSFKMIDYGKTLKEIADSFNESYNETEEIFKQTDLIIKKMYE